ncbi:MAG: TlpA disulfide reductase family protein [Thiofilum sp.]|uniref:TlpA disulfide reductase family protein n=1 Tax=Thiofilum sp. TaxID=2212733 RepID=UPI0025E4ECE3|nr:TlpA disulfide reductase family protein [Thiofilum sp.]MBK8453577.1 TlpA family protein disulfide reductase [Thiofilum sp.]
MKIDIKALIALGVLTAAIAFFFFMPSGGLQAAPNATVTTIDGEKIELASLKGNPYLVVFWATDCPGCVEEIPDLIKFKQDPATNSVPVIAIAMPHDNIAAIRTMREQKQMNYSIAFDQDGALTKAFGGVKVTPTNFLVNAEGKIVLAKMGNLGLQDLQKRVAELKAG